MSDAFDILNDDNIDPEVKVKPFFRIKDKNEKEKHQWLNSVTEALIKQSEIRTLGQRENLQHYRGISMRKSDRFRNRDKNRQRFSRIQKFVVNHLHDLTETKVSQMTRLKPAVEILPTNDEWKDRASAKVVKLIINHLWDMNDVDGLFTKMQRQTRIFGESYCFTLWDDKKGDLTPAYVAARDAGLDLKRKEIQEIKYTGDISYEMELPWRVLLHRASDFNKCDYVIRVKVIPTEELKEKYPEKKKDIKIDEDLKVFDAEYLADRKMEEHTIVFHLFHKKTELVPEGAEIIYTKDVMLKDGPLPYSHGKLPIVRLTDLDVPDVLNGVSRYEMIVPIQRMFNNIQTLIAKNIYLTAQAKWMMPRGTCKIEQLGNDNTIVQYQGAQAPQLVQVQPNSPEVYNYSQMLIQYMQTIYGSHGISRGEVPKGITAASALQFLNELENERSSTDIAKHGALVKEFAKMTIAITGDFYKPDDGRMLRIVGENNKFLIRHFDTAHLNKNYDVKVDNSTGLPETKSAKIQRVLDAMQRNPQLFTPERAEELLELGDVEKMSSIMTEAVKASDSIVEDLMAGREVAPLEEWHDFIVHWRTYSKAMQSRSFNEEADPQIRAAVKDHVFWTEKAMIRKMQKNPEFEAKVATLTLFPLFSHPEYVPARSMEQQMAMVQGQTNRGEAVTGQIPGTSTEDIMEQQNAKARLKG
jgi:hypothetical protein